MLDSALNTILTASSTFTDLVGTKLYYGRVAQYQEAPYVVYNVINRVGIQDKSGTPNIDEYIVQFDCMAEDIQTVTEIEDVIRLLLDRYAHGTVESTNLGGISWLNSHPDYDEGIELHRMITEFKVRVNN